MKLVKLGMVIIAMAIAGSVMAQDAPVNVKKEQRIAKKLEKKAVRLQKKLDKATKKTQEAQAKSDISMSALKQAVSDKKAGKLTDEKEYQDILSKANKQSLHVNDVTDKKNAVQGKLNKTKENAALHKKNAEKK